MSIEYTTPILDDNITPEHELEIDKATSAFRALLVEQYKRARKMQDAQAPKDFSTLEKIRIGLVDGDGIGPHLMKASRRIMEFLLADELAEGTLELVEISGMSIDERREAGVAIPEGAMELLRSCDVILKGPTETPKGGTLESANVAMRRALDLYANVRPVTVPSEGIDWTFFRENTEGEYVLGSRGISVGELLSMDFKVTTDAGTRRIARAAFAYAKNNGKNCICEYNPNTGCSLIPKSED